MITPHPQILRVLLSRYANARLAHAEHPTPATRLALESVSYTLCVTTATADIPQALAVADQIMERAAAPRVRRGSAPLVA